MTHHQDLITLTDSFSTVPSPVQGTVPIGSPDSINNILTNEEMMAIGQLATELINDPIALQHLCDHIYRLLLRDLARQDNHF